MVRLLAVYFVPRRRKVNLHRMKAIMLALSQCQQFYTRQAGLALNWRLHPTPVLGSGESSTYNDNDRLEKEVREKTRWHDHTLGVFFDGRLSKPAYASMGDSNPEIFVIAEPHLSHLESGDHDDVVAHEIGHTLGLRDRHEGLSVMRQGLRNTSLTEPALFPWTRAHLAREDRQYLRGRWSRLESH